MVLATENLAGVFRRLTGMQRPGVWPGGATSSLPNDQWAFIETHPMHDHAVIPSRSNPSSPPSPSLVSGLLLLSLCILPQHAAPFAAGTSLQQHLPKHYKHRRRPSTAEPFTITPILCLVSNTVLISTCALAGCPTQVQHRSDQPNPTRAHCVRRVCDFAVMCRGALSV